MVKRTRLASPPPKGLAAGQVLRRDVLRSWGWVGSEITDPSLITRDHLLATCGLSKKNSYPFCRNQDQSKSRRLKASRTSSPVATNDVIPNDVIIISDDEDDGTLCGKKGCKINPNCLNHLGQEKWKDEGTTSLRCGWFIFSSISSQSLSWTTFCNMQNLEKTHCFSPRIRIYLWALR